ncbi:E3 ubiquitin-protein ligase MIEL1 [Cardamine amara subsp. amara]|uniref:E3 ubiquitin-protein ligase MIEL1 n=1 Tax=Cardamine amara subsp. amara TaxID=228776 RepID=A0ABD1AGC8_CARAN
MLLAKVSTQWKQILQFPETKTLANSNSDANIPIVVFNCMGEYFCDICKFFDDDNCGACYVTKLRDKHSCVENSTKNSCPVCYEYLFDSVKAAHVMSCGHTMRGDCFQQMTKEEEYYRCPICSKSLVDMSDEWQLLDREISATAMLVEYNFEVTVLCNDCNKRSTAMFHILGPKCAHCSSYNTRRISTPQDPVSETV